MNRFSKTSLKFFLTVLFIISASGVFAQTKTYSWIPPKTKFKVPTDFVVDESSETKWSGHNSNITLSIFPRKNEKLPQSDMQKALYKWASDNGVTNIGEITEVDPEKLNGYWGYIYVGEKDSLPVATMLIVDPDYPDIVIYVWALYSVEYEESVTQILMSFTPIL